MQREWLADRLRRRLQQLNVPPLVTISQNQIPFLLPERCSGAEVWKTMAQPNVALALGRLHAGIAGVQHGYREVQALVSHLKPGHVHCYEDLLLPRVLKGDVEAQTTFLKELLDPLRQQKHGDVLINSLLAFARLGFGLKQTAQQLSIHPKTLRYRLERVSELANLDLKEPDTRFKLQLAAHILSLADNAHS